MPHKAEPRYNGGIGSMWGFKVIPFSRRPSMPQLQRYVTVILVIAALTVVTVTMREFLTLANFTTIYLLAVFIIGINTRTGPAVVSAITSFFFINFFLVPPYYSLLVADPREVLDLIIFSIVAVMAGQLGARVRQQAQEADQRAREQEILYRLTRSFNELRDSQGVYEALTKVLYQDLGAKEAQILPFTPSKPADDGAAAYYLLLQVGDRIYGTARILFDNLLTVSENQLMNACISLAAMALQRIELTEQAIKSQRFEEADKLKTAILHAVSHDLRTPITIIKSSASNLRQFHEQLEPQEEAEIAETIERETDQLDQLVGNLLDMSRLQAGALSLNRRPNDVEEVVGDVAAQVWQRTKQERIKIEFPDDFPLVSFDYGLLRQAITNLVDNSLRYEPSNRQIEIRGEVTQVEMLLKVINHGRSITARERPHIMEPFYRGREGHIGLGLPIAKGIVEAHQGQLRVEDT
ncbi:MAG: DUF4118 domain-containing protein, partial [Anaerolineae bacterium]